MIWRLLDTQMKGILDNQVSTGVNHCIEIFNWLIINVQLFKIG
jgi:hypothetical protein